MSEVMTAQAEDKQHTLLRPLHRFGARIVSVAKGVDRWVGEAIQADLMRPGQSGWYMPREHDGNCCDLREPEGPPPTSPEFKRALGLAMEAVSQTVVTPDMSWGDMMDATATRYAELVEQADQQSQTPEQ